MRRAVIVFDQDGEIFTVTEVQGPPKGLSELRKRAEKFGFSVKTCALTQSIGDVLAEFDELDEMVADR